VFDDNHREMRWITGGSSFFPRMTSGFSSASAILQQELM